MTLQEYQELPKGVKIKIKKFFDKDIITDKYYKVYSDDEKGFIVGCMFYDYKKVEIVR